MPTSRQPGLEFNKERSIEVVNDFICTVCSMVLRGGIGVIVGIVVSLVPLSEQSGFFMSGAALVGCAILAVYLVQTYGYRFLKDFLRVGGVALLIQTLGLQLCPGNECFTYTSLAGPRLLGSPLSLIGIRPSMTMGVLHLMPKKLHRRGKAILGGGVLTILGLFMGPVMFAKGIQLYTSPGERFGVPREHYGLWLVTAVMSSGILTKRSRRLMRDRWLHRLGTVVVTASLTAFLLLIGKQIFFLE